MASDGIEFHFKQALVTILSATNYCGFDNMGGIFHVSENLTCKLYIIKGISRDPTDDSIRTENMKALTEEKFDLGDSQKNDSIL